MSAFYDQASLVVVPSGYKTSKVYAQKPLTTDGQLTFSRASAATRVNSAGLIEKVRTNIYPYGSNILTSHWPFKSAGTTLTQGQTDPNGGTTAMRVQFASGATNFTYFAYATTPNLPLTRSVYIKGASAQTIQFAEPYGTGAKNINITTSWARYDLAAPASVAGPYGVYFQNISNAAADFTIAFIQIETGDIATDYIATTSAAVSVGPVANVPRLDYLNSTCPKLQLEPQRTNLLLYSEQFDNAYWQKDPVASVTANAATSPDGSANADRLSFSSGNAIYRASLGLSGAHRFSVYLKGDGANIGKEIYLEIAGGTSINVTLTGSWQRFTAIADNASSVAIKRLTSGQADSVLAWGAQLEAGAYATSYIPTLGAAVTRLADVCSKTGISSLIGQTEGTIYIDVDNNETETSCIISTNAGAGAASHIYIGQNGSNLALYIRSAGTYSIIAGSIANIIGRKKIAVAYGASFARIYMNGTQVFNSTAAVIPSGLDRIEINAFNINTDIGNKKCREVLYFKSKLTDSQLAELTTL